MTEKQIITDDNGTFIAEYTTTYEYNGNNDVITVTDALGNITRTEYNAINIMSASIDANGNRTEYEYDDRGNQSKVTYVDNNYLYTGEQFDPNMGFYYLRARYMNPAVGRFTSMDTWAGNKYDPVTLNKYLYANADPVNHIDPSGNFSIGSLMKGINLTAAVISFATADYTSILEGDFTVGKALEAGKLIVISAVGFKAVKFFAKKLYKKAGCDKANSKNLFCDLVKSPRKRINKYRKIFNISKKKNIAFADYITTSGFGTMVAHSGKFSQPGTETMPNDRRYQTGVVNFPRAFDSEVKIYENLAIKLKPGAKGIIHLASERIICRSCNRVGMLFKGDYLGAFLITRGGF